MVELNFNANEVEPQGDFEPIPAGNYLAAITETENKPTKSGDGSYLQMTFQILDGEFKGRSLWSRLNRDNPSDTAVRIANAELSAICRAVGVMEPKNSQDLHNLPLTLKVIQEKRRDNGEMANRIKGYEKKSYYKNAGQPVKVATGVGPDETPPWMKKKN